MLLAILNAALASPIFAVVAVVLIGLLIWGARNPLVWRILSVLGMGAGAGYRLGSRATATITAYRKMAKGMS
jgi:hypothetical protein